MFALRSFIVFAVALLSLSPANARKPPPMKKSLSPSPPPVPVIPTCGVFVAFTKLKTNFTANDVKNKAVCNKFAALMKAHYATPFPWSCNFIGSTHSDGTGMNTVTVQAYPELAQATAVADFMTLFNRNRDAQSIMTALQGSCDDSLTLTTSCPNTNAANIKKCQASSPPPSVPKCNLTIILDKAMGFLTQAQCATFGNNINTLYGSRFSFSCQGLQYTNTEMTIAAINNVNSNAALGKFLDNVKTNKAAAAQLVKLYGLTCGVDKVHFSSGSNYNSACGASVSLLACS